MVKFPNSGGTHNLATFFAKENATFGIFYFGAELALRAQLLQSTQVVAKPRIVAFFRHMKVPILGILQSWDIEIKRLLEKRQTFMILFFSNQQKVLLAINNENKFWVNFKPSPFRTPTVRDREI